MKQSEQKEQSCIWIVEALFLLMKNKPFNDISIKEIADKAGVSRLTYYRNFRSKEEIILKFYNIMFEKFLLKFNDVNEKELDLNKLIVLSFEYFEDNKEKVGLLVRDDLIYLLLRPFSDYIAVALKKINIPDPLNYFQLKFIEGGLLSALFNWCADNRGYSPEQISANILDIVKH